MITREKNFFMNKMILPFIVIEDKNFHEDENHVTLHWFFLRKCHLAKHTVVKFHLQLSSKRHFYKFLTFFKLEKTKILH